MVHFIPNDIAIVALLSIFGYLLSSVDIISKFRLIKSKNKVQNVLSEDFARISSSIIPSKPALKTDHQEIIYHLIMIFLTITCSMLIYNLFTYYQLTASASFQVESALLYICLALFLVIKICSSLQNVYILFGFVRNPFYPKNGLNENLDTDFELTINYRKTFFQALKYIRIILLKFGKYFKF